LANLCVNAGDAMTSAGPQRELNGKPAGDMAWQISNFKETDYDC